MEGCCKSETEEDGSCRERSRHTPSASDFYLAARLSDLAKESRQNKEKIAHQESVIEAQQAQIAELTQQVSSLMIAGSELQRSIAVAAAPVHSLAAQDTSAAAGLPAAQTPPVAAESVPAALVVSEAEGAAVTTRKRFRKRGSRGKAAAERRQKRIPLNEHTCAENLCS